LCVLNDVTLTANADLKMDQGDLLVNGDIALGPRASVVNTGGRLYVNGSVTGYIAGQTLLQDVTGVLLPAAVPKTGAITAPVVDLSAALGQPVTAPSAPACTPGTYALLDACDTLAPGVYVVTGGTSFTRAGATTIQATGVTFVLACSRTTAGVTRSSACASGEPGGSIEVGGRATLNLSVPSPPAYPGICFGLAIVSDPNNTGQLWVHGTNAQLNITGSIYLKSGTLNYGGGPDLTVAGNIIVGQYLGNGNPGMLHALGCGPASGGGGGGIHLLR